MACKCHAPVNINQLKIEKEKCQRLVTFDEILEEVTLKKAACNNV